jgi:hypothetical protein
LGGFTKWAQWIYFSFFRVDRDYIYELFLNQLFIVMVALDGCDKLLHVKVSAKIESGSIKNISGYDWNTRTLSSGV